MSVFKRAYDEAKVLKDEVNAEINRIQGEIDNLRVVENDAAKFINSISQIVE